MSYSRSAAPSSSTDILQAIIPLIPSNPDALPLLRSLQPFKYPSLLPRSDVHKLLTRLNGHILNKELGPRATQERKDSWQIAKCLLDQDEEGYVIGGWGKNWVSGLMPLVSFPAMPSSSVAPLLSLLTTLFALSPAYPSFSRETALPAIPKYSQALVGVLTRAEEKASWDIIAITLPHLPTLLKLSPTPHRPLIPTLLPLLQRFLILAPLSAPTSVNRTSTIRALSATLLSTLHILTGKVSAPASWKTDLLSTINEIHACISGITRGGFVEQGQYSSAGAGAKGPITTALGMLDPSLSEEERIERLGNCLDGWLDLLFALMRYPTARPVTLPVGLIVSLGLRIFSLHYDTPAAPHISHEHKAKLMAILPKLWVLAAKILGRLTMAIGDHMLPSLGPILEHSIYLQETLPKAALASRVSLLRFHKLLLSRLRPDPSSSALPTRLLKDCLASIATVLSPRPAPTEEQSAEALDSNSNGLSKKGKKRMRNAGEETLVAGMEGRGGKSMTKPEGQVVLAALELIPHLLGHLALPEHLLTFAIRIHLSLSLALPSRSAASISNQDIALRDKLIARVAKVLECAMGLSGGHGSRRPWTSLIVSLPELQSSANLPLLLHPELPPLSRPLPPSSSLDFYRPETSEEKALRVDLGVSKAGEALSDVTDADMEAAARSKDTPSDDADVRRAKRQAVERPVDQGGAAISKAIAETTTAANVFGNTLLMAPIDMNAPASSLLPVESSGSVAAGSVHVNTAASSASLQPATSHSGPDSNGGPSHTAPDSSAFGFSTAGLPAASRIAQSTTNPASESSESRPLSSRPDSDISLEGKTSERAEGLRYDSEGEEIPEICLDSDTEDENGESDEDMA